MIEVETGNSASSSPAPGLKACMQLLAGSKRGAKRKRFGLSNEFSDDIAMTGDS